MSKKTKAPRLNVHMMPINNTEVVV